MKRIDGKYYETYLLKTDNFRALASSTIYEYPKKTETELKVERRSHKNIKVIKLW